MELIEIQPVLDAVLDEHRAALGAAFAAYRGHVYRTFNVARAVLGHARHDDALAVISAFHDLGIWSDGTFDYLSPSAARAESFLDRAPTHVEPSVVSAAIANHHCLRAIRRGPEPELAEAFRRADLIDVSRGALRFGVPRAYLRELRVTFPVAGFHGVLARAALGWLVRHPLRPLPMLRLTPR